MRPATSTSAFAAEGRTADHVIIHADSKATNLIDQKSFYVGISRAKESATIVTNDRAKLVSAINERAGKMQTAITQTALLTSRGGGINSRPTVLDHDRRKDTQSLADTR